MRKLLFTDVLLRCGCGQEVSAKPRTLVTVSYGTESHGRDSGGLLWRVLDVERPDGWEVKASLSQKIEDSFHAKCPSCLGTVPTDQKPAVQLELTKPETSALPAPPVDLPVNRHILPLREAKNLSRHVSIKPGPQTFKTAERPVPVPQTSLQRPAEAPPAVVQLLTPSSTPVPKASEIPTRNDNVQTALTAKKAEVQTVSSSNLVRPAGVVTSVGSSTTVTQTLSGRISSAPAPVGVSVSSSSSARVNPSVLGPQPVVSSAIVRPSVTPTTFVGVPPRVVK